MARLLTELGRIGKKKMEKGGDAGTSKQRISERGSTTDAGDYSTRGALRA